MPSPRASRPRSPKTNESRGIAKARTKGTDTSNLNAEQMAEVISPDKPLTEMQRNFARLWGEGETIANAATRAGYAGSDGVGYRMAKMPNILKLKNEIAAKYEAASQMTRKKVMDGLMEAVEMAKLMAEPATMVSGWREIGKMCGYYAPVEHRVKVDVSGNIVLDRLNNMTDAELLKMITAGSAPTETPLLEDES